MKKLNSYIKSKTEPYSEFPRITLVETLPPVKLSRFYHGFPVINTELIKAKK